MRHCRISDFLLIAMSLAIILCLATGKLVRAAEHDHSAMPPSQAEFYTHWNMPPKRESSCCDLKDCYDTLFRTRNGKIEFLVREIIGKDDKGFVIREGVTQAKDRGEWAPMRMDVLEENQTDPYDSPDGLNHVCEAPGETGHYVFCAVRGGGQ